MPTDRRFEIHLPANAKFWRRCLGLLFVLLAGWILRGQATGAPPQTQPAAVGDATAAEAPVLDGQDGRNLALDQFRPKSMLKLTEHRPPRAKFPVVDVHMHPRIKGHSNPDLLDDYVRQMDEQNVALCVSLDGQLGEQFDEHAKFLWTKYRNRWVIFANIPWQGSGQASDPASWDCQRPDFGRRMAEQLAAVKAKGASGLKIFKDFGLSYKNPDGSLIKIDDPRWDAIWDACGKLGLPILIHVGDPAAFFEPIDQHNERWEELRRHPDWSFRRPGYPTLAEIHAAFLRVVARHPQAVFITAHLGNSPEDLSTLAGWLDKYPNLNTEIAARIGELGRQPYTARKFLTKYADRVMFGTDGPRTRARLLPHWRLLETDDEYFPYAEDDAYPPQGLWRIYGLNLSDDVLKKIYSDNAARLIPGVKEKLAAQTTAHEPTAEKN